MNILITGGAGFIGSHLCEYLLHLGHKVICLDNFEEVYPKQIKKENLKSIREHPKFNLVMADILDTDNLIDIFASKRVDLVCHLAGKSGAANSMKNPAEFVKSNIQGTVSVLEAMKEADVQMILFTSSSAVYGDLAVEKFSESDIVGMPKSVYATTKATCENLICMYSKQFDFKSVIVRLFSVYGERQRPDSGMYAFVKAALKNQPLALFSGGNIQRDYIYISELVHGLGNAIAYMEKIKSGQVELFNLGSGKGITISEIIQTIQNITGLTITTISKSAPIFNQHATVADISKAKKTFDFEPTTELKQILPHFIQWMQEERNLT